MLCQPMGSSDSKASTRQATTTPPLEVVAGALCAGAYFDGTLHAARLYSPSGLCLWGDRLIFTQYLTHSIRLVAGVVGQPNPFPASAEADHKGAVNAKHVIALVARSAGLLPKELSAIIAEYAHSPLEVGTIARSSWLTATVMDMHCGRRRSVCRSLWPWTRRIRWEVLS
jgi:hypothetical protein